MKPRCAHLPITWIWSPEMKCLQVSIIALTGVRSWANVETFPRKYFKKFFFSCEWYITNNLNAPRVQSYHGGINRSQILTRRKLRGNKDNRTGNRVNHVTSRCLWDPRIWPWARCRSLQVGPLRPPCAGRPATSSLGWGRTFNLIIAGDANERSASGEWRHGPILHAPFTCQSALIQTLLHTDGVAAPKMSGPQTCQRTTNICTCA